MKWEGRCGLEQLLRAGSVVSDAFGKQANKQTYKKVCPNQMGHAFCVTKSCNSHWSSNLHSMKRFLIALDLLSFTCIKHKTMNPSGLHLASYFF